MKVTRRAALASALAAAATGLGPARILADAAPVTILRLRRRNIEVKGKAASVYEIAQPDGTAGITTQVGQRFRARVENEIAEPSLIHWHGLTPPWRQDGVPGISGPPIPPGGSADYDFPLPFGGTFWMHSHQGFQEQLLMSAPLIIRDARDPADQQEVVLMLRDFSFTPPEEIYAGLRKPKNMAGMGGKPSGMAMTPKAGAADAPDLNDVAYDAFLANDRTLDDPEIVRVDPGARLLLRAINASSMSNFHLDLGALNGELIAVDGFRVKPVTARRFPLAVAQRLDIRIAVPRGPIAYPVLAVLEGAARQTGIVLRANAGSVARVPDMAAASPSPALTLDLEENLQAMEPLTPRVADRTHTIDLTGDMASYVWSINNQPWTRDTPPLLIAEGERVELVLVNKTRMPHPMHLHGHQFQVVEIDGRPIDGAVRDTILVPPGARVVLAFDAGNPGWWAFHCHLLYHLEAGMFATFRYV